MRSSNKQTEKENNHAFINTDRFTIFTKSDSRIFRSNFWSRLRIFRIDFKGSISSSCDKWKSPFVKFFIAEHADVVSVVVFKFFVVEYSRCLVQMFKLESLCKFFKSIKFLSFFVRTAKHSNVVYDSLWKITPGTEFVYRS